MAARTVTLMLNQQQRALMGRTLATGVAPDLESLVKLAIRELAAQTEAAK